MTVFLAEIALYTLSFFFWLIVGRVILDVLVTVFAGGRPNFFTELFARGTDPLFAVVRLLTFGKVSEGLIPVVTMALLLLLRLPLAPLLAGTQ
ncbi:MAG: hypothetical protein KatS3mg061_1763 [Dehalococcoidia bacterium]|nr:MAG: hypothetical protein KatS3mg061_1763 [Dehalococcoidia bacterium]